MVTMRTVSQDELGGPEVLRLVEIERPAPGPAEVLVKVHAAGINPVDAKSRSTGGMRGMEPPFRLGWDVSGTVEAVGAGVRIHQVGDAVYGMPHFPRQAGGFSEYVTAPARHFAPKPANLSHVEAAALPLAGLTAYQALVDVAAVAAGDRVLVIAAGGGVGHLAVQIAKAKGAYVIATASTSKQEFVRRLGADEVVDYTRTDFTEHLRDLDIVVDPIGGEYAAKSASVLKDGGHLVSIIPGELTEAEQERVHTGFMLVEPDLAGLRAITALVEAGKVRPEVEQTFPLEATAKAHEAIETGRTAGKIVVTII